MGRRSLYKKEYCARLVEHMKGGKSFESFASKVGVGRRTIYSWVKAHSDFLDARSIGQAESFAWWEQYYFDVMQGKKRGNPTLIIFAMKNRFKWRDNHKEKDKGDAPTAAAPITPLTPEQIAALVKSAREGK